jgi:hypothetical protein
MPFTVQEFRDLVQILEERPEWRTELRRLVLTDELLSLPQQVVELRVQTEQQFQELAAAQRRTEEQVTTLSERVTELATAQRRTEEQVATLSEQVTELTRSVQGLTNEVGELKGESLEARYRTRPYAYFSRLIRRAHVLSAEELSVMLEEAIDQGVLSEAQAQEIALADVVVRGRRREDGREIYLVAEVSWGVGPYDVERAVQRAALLAKVGLPALPVVAGRSVTAEAVELARTKEVWQLTDGQALPPEPTTDPSI